MKKLLFVLLCTISIQCTAQNTNNSIGIGLGNMMIYPDIGPGNNVEINSPFYNSRGNYLDKTITKITSPNVYFRKSVYKNLIIRLNGSFNYRTSYYDPTGSIIEPGPGYNYDKNVYHNVSYHKVLNSNIGFQYNFNFGKWTIYPAIEYASVLFWYKLETSYTISPYLGTSHEEVFRDKERWQSVNLLGGLEYRFRKCISFSYEMGLYHDYFSPISRLSVNVNF